MAIDVDNLGLHDRAGRVGLEPVRILVDELAHVNETLNSILDLDEDAEVGDVDNLTLDHLTEVVAGLNGEPWVFGELLDAQREPLALFVDGQDACLHLVALLEAIFWVANALTPGQVGDVHKAVDAVLDTHEDTEVGDVANRTADHAADGVLLLDEVPRVHLELLHAERDALVLDIHAEDLGLDHVALVDQLAWVLDALVPGHLADVDKTLDAVLELDECTVVGDAHDLAANDGTHGVLELGLFPWIRPDLLESEADTLAVGVKLEDLDFDRLADLEHLTWMVEATVRHVGDVEQAVDTTEVDEATVVGDVLDDAVEDDALGEHLERLAPLALALLLEQHPTGEHDVAALLVELDDLELERLAQVLVEVLDGTEVHLGAREERLDADIDLQTTLDAALHHTRDDLVGCNSLGDLVPSLHLVSLALREEEGLRVFLHGAEVDVDRIAHSDGDFTLEVAELVGWDQAFGLVSNIDGHPVIVDVENPTLNDRLLADALVAHKVVEERRKRVCGQALERGVKNVVAHGILGTGINPV